MSFELIGSAGKCPLNLDDCTNCPSLEGCPEVIGKLAKGSAKYLGLTEADRLKDGLDEVTLNDVVNRSYPDCDILYNDNRLLYPYGEATRILTGNLDFTKENNKMKKFFNILKKKDYETNKVLVMEKASKHVFTGKGFGSSDFEMYSPIKIEEKQIDDEHLAVRMIASSLIKGVVFKARYGMVFTRPAIQERIQTLLDDLNNDISEREKRAAEEAIAQAEQIAVQSAADIAMASLSATITSAVGAVPETTIENTISQIPKKERDYRGALALVTALGSYISLLMLNTRWGVKPEMICGPVPLYSVQMTERAKSDRKLKNRAIGDVFLAHQKGNRDILRVDGVLDGPLRYTYLWVLVQLQKEGEGKAINLSQSNMPVFAEGAPAAIEELETAAKGQLNYEIYKTFPIITQFQILTDMYLQTVEWHRAIEDGQELIRYHLLFRKYFPTNVWRAFNPLDIEDESEPLTSSKFKVYSLGRKNRQWIEAGIDAMWKMWKMFGEIYPHLALQSDGKNVVKIDREALRNYKRLSISYAGKLLGIFK